MVAPTCDVYVGSETGLFKGVNTEKKSFQNFNGISELNRENEITSLCFQDEVEDKVFLSQKNQVIKLFDCNSNSFVKQLDLNCGEGSLRGLVHYNNRLITATDTGIIRLWNCDGEQQQVEINAGENLYRLRQNISKPQHIATGGEENELKIWDVENPTKPVFQAKNVRNDFLDLRVPVWVTDMQFLPDSNKIVSCTRHHHIRLYDPNGRQRRPVITMDFETFPLLSLSLAHREHQLVVGSSRGRMALIDLRRKALVHVYKGFAGSIRSVQCHPQLPLVASCGLDRFLRIHEMNSHKLLRKIYLKSKLNCLLMRSNISNKLLDPVQNVDAKEVSSSKREATTKQRDGVWDQMAVIKQKIQEKRNFNQDSVCSRKKKPKFVK